MLSTANYLIRRAVLLILTLLLGGHFLQAQTPSFYHRDLASHFDARDVGGSITLYHLETNTWISSDRTDWKVPTLPASTFKVVNSLIALETQVIPDENEVLPYQGHDTTLYGVRKDIQHDMDLKEALERSVVWYYLVLAERIGCERYQDILGKLPYGNGKIDCAKTDFWNIGEFAVTPVEQISLLVRLYRETLPFEARHQQTMKRIMLNKGFEGYEVRAKTGWAFVDEVAIGWWIGYVTINGEHWFFATRLRKPEAETTWDFARHRKEVTLDVLRELEVLPVAVE